MCGGESGIPVTGAGSGGVYVLIQASNWIKDGSILGG